MNQYLKVSTQVFNKNTILIADAAKLKAYYKCCKIDSVASSDVQKYIASQWFQERHRQARKSFNVTIGLWIVTAFFSVGIAVSVCTGNVPSTIATTSVGITTGAVSTRFFRLYKEANNNLDDVTRELLE